MPHLRWCAYGAVVAALTTTTKAVLVHRAAAPPVPAGILLSNEEIVPVDWAEFEQRAGVVFADAGVDAGHVHPIISLVATPEGERVTAIINGKPRTMPIGPEDVSKLDEGEMLHLDSLGSKYRFDPKRWGARPDSAIARMPDTVAHHSAAQPSDDDEVGMEGEEGPDEGEDGGRHPDDETEVGVHHSAEKDTTVVYGHEDGVEEDGYDDAPMEHEYLEEDGPTPEVQDGEHEMEQEIDHAAEYDMASAGLLSRRPSPNA